MTAQEHILAELQELARPVPLQDIGKTPVEDVILAKVLSKKFRKLKADDELIAIAKKAISISVKASKPIIVSVTFGGNKLWRLDEAPEIDWAELFATIYFLSWMKQIASVYEPGAHLEFFSEDVVLENMNNLPRSETDRYTKSFKAMLEWLQQYMPKNISVSYKRYGDAYHDVSEYLAELEEVKKKVLAENGGQLPHLSDAQKAATEMNVRLRPGQADDPLWREKVELIHQSIERTKTAESYFLDPSLIPACPTPYPACLTTGSTKKSLAKFWVGVGALEKSGDGYSDLVLTPKQLAAASFDWEPVHLEGLPGKNFSRIRILAQ